MEGDCFGCGLTSELQKNDQQMRPRTRADVSRQFVVVRWPEIGLR